MGSRSEGITKVEIWLMVYWHSRPHMGESVGTSAALFQTWQVKRIRLFASLQLQCLSAGPHTITAVAHNALGETKRAARFEVVRFDSPFISDPNAVNLNNASCTVSSDEISIVDALVEGSVYDLRLKWRIAEQGFEIIEIR